MFFISPQKLFLFSRLKVVSGLFSQVAKRPNKKDKVNSKFYDVKKRYGTSLPASFSA